MQLWQRADSERQAASEMEIKCLKMRPELSLLRSLRKEERDSRRHSAHRATDRSCGVGNSALLASIFFVCGLSVRETASRILVGKDS